MSEAPVPDALSAALADRYRIEEHLGEGAASVVWGATDLRHDRRVAIKVLRPELAAELGARRFLDEIRTTANLRHPHILPLFDSGDLDGVPFFVMPLVEGESLEARLEREGALPLDEALSIARDVGSALSHAHAHGILHRDIKPANVLLGEGGALVADFGVAVALAGEGRERLTAEGLAVGTPTYMSPEQIEDGAVDARSDVFALGALLYEMLAGKPPFRGSTLQALLAQILTGPAPSLAQERPEVPDAVDRAVARALAKRPEDRFDSVDALLEVLAPAAAPRRASSGIVLGFAASLLILLFAGIYGWRALQRSEARASLVEIQRLVDEERYVEAFALARDAERWIPEDSTLRSHLARSSDLLTIETDPPGARVRLERYAEDRPPGAATGSRDAPAAETRATSPVRELRLPRAQYRLLIELDGFLPIERMVSSEFARREGFQPPDEARHLELRLGLTPVDSVPPGMVPVPGGEYALVSADAPEGMSHALEPYFIDRLEVSNEAYAAFLDAGGYGLEEPWAGVPDAIRGRLVDRTGLPGPRGWVAQRPPEEEGRMPVAGVSWYEARAYCRWRSRRLPTIYEWEKAARNGRSSSTGVIMPWGYARSTDRAGSRANFGSDGPVPVDDQPFGVSPYGARGMAGNVKEWLANASAGGRITTGGSWAGPSYLYSEYAAVEPGSALPDLGFRCARAETDADQGAGPLELAIEAPVYTPVDEDRFRELLAYYRYDPVPPRPRLAGRTETPAWTRERVWIDGVGQDSILVYLWTPVSAAAPFQTIVYVASGAAFFGTAVAEEAEWVLGPLIRGGRAVVAPVLRGMRERPLPADLAPPEPPSVGFRDLMVRHATELRLAMDWAETRPEVDGDAFAYAAFSFGAGSRLGLSAVDDRYRAVIYIGGGIDERVKPTLPEADNVNFAPYVSAPILMVNGTHDEEHPWLSRALPLWNLLPEPKELELVEGAGHLPPVEARIPAMSGFLDRVLGPVERP